MSSKPQDKSSDAESAAEVVEEADKAIGKAMAAKRHHPWVKKCADISEIGDQEPLYVIGAVATISGLLMKNPRCAVAGLAFLAAVGVADATKSTVKRLVKRSRPNHAIEEGGEYCFEVGGSADKKKQSFPSGHVAGTVAAAETVARFYPASAPYVRGSAVLLSLARVIKGSHWPLDLAAGALIGLAADRAIRLVVHDGVLERAGVEIPEVDR